MRTARYWHPTAGGAVQCELCPHGCRLPPGAAGLCRVRLHRDGELKAAGYGAVSSAHVDPIEKKPLHHFLPGSAIFSVGGWGCNFRCRFCQNWTISQQFRDDGSRQTPEEVAEAAAACGSVGVAYTYNEPLVGFEFVRDCAERVRARGLVNVLVTNGYVNPAPAAELLPWVEALNVDIKSMDEAFYRQQCGARLQPVLDFCAQAAGAGRHVEITNLIIPGLNDSEDGLRRLAEWVAERLGERTPLHLSAYHPQYQCRNPPTPVETLRRAYELCREKLRYVYVGNVAAGWGEDTACPQCGEVLIRRRGYAVGPIGLRGHECRRCGRRADLVLSVAEALALGGAQGQSKSPA